MFRQAVSKVVARGCNVLVAQQRNEVVQLQRFIPQNIRCIGTSSTPLRTEAEKSFDGPIDLDKPQVREKGSEKVRELAGEIVNLTLLEVNDLVEILQEKLNLPPATGMPMGGMMMGMGGMPPGPNVAAADGAAPAEAKEEKSEFDLKMESFDKASKIKVIKEIRAVTNLGLKEAKDLVEGVPVVIKKLVKKEDAEEIIAKLKEVGAVVVME